MDGTLSYYLKLSYFALASILKGDYIFNRVNIIEKKVITTKGCVVQVRWADQSTDCVSLIMIEESNLFKFTEQAVSNGYNNNPEFCWWVTKVLNK